MSGETRHERVSRMRADEAGREARRAGLVVIGCSLGGLNAMQIILGALPENFQVPIAVAQHRHTQSTDVLAHYLQRFSALPVADAEDMQQVEGGRIYLAPANYHLMVDGHTFRLSADDAVHYSRPSIDVLFESAADAYKSGVVAIILTGANEDGTAGVTQIRKMGGLVVAQDPAEAEAPLMPAAAIATGSVDQILSLAEIAEFLSRRIEMAA